MQIVGCFTIQKGSEQKIKACEFTNSAKEKTSIDLFSVIYTVDFYEAKTGKKIKSTTINGAETTCPYIAAYDKSNPKLYSDADEGSINLVLDDLIKQDSSI